MKKGSPLAKAGVREVARLASDSDLVAVQMDEPFEVPRKKGPEALPLWDAQAKAGASVIMRTASSRVNSCRSRTQYPSRCVWIEKSAIWLT